MKQNIKDSLIILLFIVSLAFLAGCSTFKGLANYRSQQKDKCECAPAWGCQFN